MWSWVFIPPGLGASSQHITLGPSRLELPLFLLGASALSERHSQSLRMESRRKDSTSRFKHSTERIDQTGFSGKEVDGGFLENLSNTVLWAYNNCREESRAI